MPRCSCTSNVPGLGREDLAWLTELSWHRCSIHPCIQVSKTSPTAQHRGFPAGHIHVALVWLWGHGPSPGGAVGTGGDVSCGDSAYTEFSLGKQR